MTRFCYRQSQHFAEQELFVDIKGEIVKIGTIEREEIAQFITCILNALLSPDPLPELAAELRRFIEDRKL